MTNRTVRYRHRQIGSLPLVLSLVAFVVLIGVLASAGAHVLAVAVAAFVFFWLAQFWSLTVTVDDDTVRLEFGLGIIHKTIPSAQIDAARVVRNRWYYGWGIRLYPGGWLFNVSGLRAVEVELRDGRKYRIGTDEPAELLAAIERSATAPEV